MSESFNTASSSPAEEWSETRVRVFLREMFDAAVASASPFHVLARFLPEKPKGRCVVVGAGKAAASMAAALEAAWPDVPLEGVVVTRDGHAMATQSIRVLEASHPVPDERSEQAAREILKTVKGLQADDLVIALISGGGSALLALPAEGITLDEKKQIARQLLHSGATITEMNTVRRHLSAIKGGRLAQAAYPARVVSLVISDVPGDDPSVIASGPTVQDETTAQDVLRILHKYDLTLPLMANRSMGAKNAGIPERCHSRSAGGRETRSGRLSGKKTAFYKTRIRRISFTLVSVGPVITRSSRFLK